MKNNREAVLCFVLIGEKVVMINRNKPPFMGCWNAVGGKVEKGETLEQACKREIKEETGISVENVDMISRFTWNYDDEIGYAFISRVDKTELNFPVKTNEGIIDLKEIDWVLDEKNYGVIEDLRVFIDDIKQGRKQNYHLTYAHKKLVKVDLVN